MPDTPVLPDNPENCLQDLLPITSIPSLTNVERESASRYQNALHILGPSAGAILTCPGNQVGWEESHKCAYANKCELLKAGKAPQGENCPVESLFIVSRFNEWSKELDKSPTALSASERAFVSELVFLDLQEARCSAILSRGEAARFTQVNIHEINPLDPSEPISWERVLHANATMLDTISNKRRILLKEWMISPEQKAKKARWERINNPKEESTDISSRQAALATRLRMLKNIPVIDVTED